MKKIGLSGIMGAGKSTVIKILKEYKIPVLDCDEINANLLLPNEIGYKKLIDHFGEVLLDHQKYIDKKKMSDLIFKDPIKKKEAENILHPLIKQRVWEEMDQYENEKIVVVEVPLLFELGWEYYFDETWVVVCGEKTLLKRLSLFRGVDEKEAKRRLQYQMSQELKKEKADIVLYNDGDLDDLKKQIYDLIQ